MEFHSCVLFFLWSAISAAQLCSVGAIFQALWCGMVLSKNINTLYRLQFNAIYPSTEPATHFEAKTIDYLTLSTTKSNWANEMLSGEILCGDVLKSCLVSYCIASLVSFGCLLGHLLWLTGNCVQLNWSSILLDGYKKLSSPRQPSHEALLVRRLKNVKTIDSTVWLPRAGTLPTDISITFYLSSFLLLLSLLF